MLSVFDVAASLLARSENQTMGTVHLQKLCFYSFGWYAHLTGDALFGEQFYAMEHGPVVGELLSAHARKRRVSAGVIHAQQEAHSLPTGTESIDAYTDQIIDAVYKRYAPMPTWTTGSREGLVEASHKEDVWREAWDCRPADTRRAIMKHERIIGYFFGKPMDPELAPFLPEPAVTVLPPEAFEEPDTYEPDHEFVDAVLRLVQSV